MTRGLCWHQNFVPWGCLPLTWGYIHVHLLNHKKSQRLKCFFLNLQQMTIVVRPSCWNQNFGPNGLPGPTLGLCLTFFSSITADYTPGIHAGGYIVFVFPFIRSYVRSFVRPFVIPSVRGITSKFYVKASQVGYISPTTHQKAFLFGP